MKKTWFILLVAGGLLLAGCQPRQASQPARGSAKLAEIAEIQMADAKSGCLGAISPDSISQGVYDALQGEWDSWNRLSREQQMLSSHYPGSCTRDFDSWAECEAFLGFSIPNPLEECDWLEKATYVGMPVGFRGAPRVQASWYGTGDGHVEWIHATAGYRSGEIQVIISASVYGDPAETKSPDSGWSVELERQGYLAGMDGAPLQISSDSGERYCSDTAYQAQGPVLYCFHVVGEPGAQDRVRDTLEQVVGAFPFQG